MEMTETAHPSARRSHPAPSRRRASPFVRRLARGVGRVARRLVPVAFALALLAGCASTSPDAAFRDVAGDVHDRLGHRPTWERGSPDDRKVEEALDRLLAREMTADESVQIALLNNPSLRASYEELSLAQADLVEAGLLKNPVLGGGVTAWEKEHIAPNLFFTVEQDFLDLLMLPLRKRVARAQLEATKLRIGDEVLALANEVRCAFYAAQAAEQVVAVRRLVREAAEASADLAKRQHEAGTMNDLALYGELGLASEVRLDLAHSEAASASARERLIRLLGLWGKRTAFRIAPRLPELPKEEVALEHLEAEAMRERLDIASNRREVQVLGYTLSVAKTSRWVGFVNVQVEAARLRNERRIAFGPSASIELPLFNQGQATIARLEAMKRISENRLRARAIDVRSEVREKRAQVVLARTIVEEYGKVLVPVRESLVRLSQEQYDAMLLGVYQLLAAKQSEFTAYREYIEALRDYWVARSELERAVGARLSEQGIVKRGGKS